MKTHYDVLNLDKNCSAKEIKESFLKLSKEYHPDRNKRADAHKKFVEVNEAYSVLGKIESRRRYDESLSASPRMEYRPYGNPYNFRVYKQYDHMHWENYNQYEKSAYARRMKFTSVIFCCFLILLGSSLHLRVINSKRFNRSHQIALSLKEERERKMKLTKKEQIEELMKSFKGV